MGMEGEPWLTPVLHPSTGLFDSLLIVWLLFFWTLKREEGRPSSKKMLNASQQHLRKSGSIVDLMLKEEPGITNMFQRHKKMMQQQKNDETHQKDERKSLKYNLKLYCSLARDLQLATSVTYHRASDSKPMLEQG